MRGSGLAEHGDWRDVRARVAALAADFAAQRDERLARTRLDRADFDRLAEAGWLRVAVPASHGGLFDGVRTSIRPIAEMLRTVARGDGSVALVAAMHPAVLIYWAALAEADAPFEDAWRAQREAFFDLAREGHWWGTLTSEPGSGGDILRTRTLARPSDGTGHWRLTGDKHFGSGSGIASFMITTAMPEGAKIPDLFVLDMRDARWDGSGGLALVAEWDGHGMRATQSHAFRLVGFDAVRSAWPGGIARAAGPASWLGGCVFSAVILGVVDTAVEAARRTLEPRKDALRAFERVEWTRAVQEAWLCEQAFEGMLRGVEAGTHPFPAVANGKAAIAELAERLTLRLCKVVGGGTYSQRSPFGRWAEDVRALGFLRPPWGLAYDQLWAASWPA